MFAPPHQRLRRRLSVPTSGSARRRARQRLHAQQTRKEGERLARERREIRARERMEQQRQALEELASYEPWGRAGGGAPNPHGVRYTNLRSTGIYPEDELKGLTLHECNIWRSPVRRRRAFASFRLREDPQTCFVEHLRRTVDNDIRYRRTPDQQHSYKQILDDMVEKKKKNQKEEVKQNLEFERKMQTMEGPWGKPGPGGTTWRNPRDIGLNFSKSMGWTDNDIFRNLKCDHTRQKRSSLALPKVKKDDDYKKSDQSNKENEKPSNVDKLPKINKLNGTKQNNQQETRKNSDDEKDVKEENSKSNRSKKSPRKSKFVKRLSNGDRVNKTLPDHSNNSNIKNGEMVLLEKKPTPESAILRLTGGVELVPLLARRRRIGTRTLPSSDVTRPPEEACQWREILNVDYLRELKHQMKAKYQQKEESRRDSAESVRQHHVTWASLWGRPGHGAPQRGRYARNNLAQLLYVAPLANVQ